MSLHNYVTVIQTPYPVNKHLVGGKLVPKAVSNGLATTQQVEDTAKLHKLMQEISEHENRVLILGYIPETVGLDSYKIVTKESEDKDAHEYARTKENFVFSSWFVLDRDSVGDPTLDGLTEDEWFEKMEILCPGIGGAAGILVPSNSNRVEGFESNGCHFLTQCENPEELKTAGTRMLLTAWANGLGVYKTAKGGAKLKRTIFDATTFSPERLLYEGKPVAVGREVKGQVFTLREGGRVDLSKITWPEDIPEGLSRNGEGVVQSGELTWETAIETQDYGFLTLREIHDKHKADEHVRCQATFRESDSWNGYVGWHTNETPFLYDNGQHIKYVVDPPVVTENEFAKNMKQDSFTEKLSDDVIFPDDNFGDLVKAIYRTMWRPNKVLALLAAIGCVAYLAGGKYRGMSRSDTLNMYGLGVGASGIGKGILVEAPGEVIRCVFCGDNNALAKAKIGVVQKLKTDAGIEEMFISLGDRPDILFTWDEFGLAMSAIASNKQNWMATVLDFALEIWPVAHQHRTKRILAIDKGEQTIINAPHLNIIGASTESTLVDGITVEFIRSGKGARMLMLPANPYKEGQQRMPYEMKLDPELAKDIKVMFSHSRTIKFGGELEGLSESVDEKRVTSPERITWDDDVMDAFFENGNIEFDDPEGLESLIRNRATPLVKKLAMIRAVICNPSEPVVTLEHVEWAREIVDYSHRYQMYLFKDKVGESYQDRAEKAVLSYVQAAGGKWVKQGKLLDLSQMRKMDASRRVPFLDYLVNDVKKLEREVYKGVHGPAANRYRLMKGEF